MKRTITEAFKVVDNQCLIIDGYGYFLGKNSNRIVVKQNEKTVSQIPFDDINCIILSSRSAFLSTAFINEACRHGVGIVIWGNGSPNILVASSRLSAFVEAKRAQFDAYKNVKGLNLVKKVIASKIANQTALIRYYSKNTNKRAYFEKASRSLNLNVQNVKNIDGDNISAVRNSILMLEAISSKIYWKCFIELMHYDLNFSGRDTEGVDAVNAALSYGYAILYSLTWMAILNAGLEPFAGFLHTDRPGKPSLVFDLSEPFKQRLVDRPIMSLINNRQLIRSVGALLDTRSKKLISTKIMNELYKKENYCGRKLSLISIIQSNIYSTVSELKDTGQYNEYKFKW